MTTASATAPLRAPRMEAIPNFRDCGGYATRSGRLMRGRLFRSGQHTDATEADLAALHGLGLVAVVDLRRPAERDASPSRRPAGFDALIIAAEANSGEAAPHLQAAAAGLTAETARARMLATYAGMPFRRQMQPVLARYFALLAERDGPILIHCMAGKDRTGFAVALLHHVLGVGRDDMMADYLLTTTAWPLDARMDAGRAQLRQYLDHNISDEVVEVIMGVDAAYLETAFKAMEAEHGSVDAYLDARLGLTDARRAALAEKLVA